MILSTLMHGRHTTCSRVIAENRAAGITDFVYAYTDDADLQWCLNQEVWHTRAKNFIPTKAQASLLKCYEFDPDSVMLMGSDDFIDANTYDMLRELLKTHDYISFRSILMEHNGTRYLWPGYPNNSKRHGEPAGAGKVLRRDLLDAMNWQVFSGANDRGADKPTHENIMRHSKRPIQVGVEDGAVLVDVKDRHSLTPIKAFNYLQKWH